MKSWSWILGIIALSLCTFTCVAQTSSTQGEGIVTVFRERATNRLKMFSQQDQWPVRLHKKMTLDGKPLLDMHGEQFASFRLPAGRHSIQFDHYGGPTADFDLHAGERVFVRPGFAGGQFLEAARFTLMIEPCKEALELGKDAAPMSAKFIEHPTVIAEVQFPATCTTE